MFYIGFICLYYNTMKLSSSFCVTDFLARAAPGTVVVAPESSRKDRVVFPDPVLLWYFVFSQSLVGTISSQ